MTKAVVLIDGKDYGLTIPQGGIKRSFSVLDSSKSGRLSNGEMQRDVIGTYYNYSIQFKCSTNSLKIYDEMYEVLSSPQDSHSITVPYGQEILTFQAYVTSGEDNLKKISKLGNEWSGLTVNFIATKPKRRPL